MNDQKLRAPLDLLKTSWNQYKTHFNSLVPIMLLAAIGLVLQLILLLAGSDAPFAQVGSAGSSASLGGTTGILLLVASLVYLVGLIWGLAALINKIVNKLDQPMTLGQAYSAAKPMIWPWFITGLLAGIFTVLGLILLIIPGIIIGVWLSLSPYVVFAEKKSGMEALKASKALVGKNWVNVFARLLLIGLVVGVISGVIGWVAQMILGYNVGSFVHNLAALILIPWAILYQYDLYKDLKAVNGNSVNPAPVEVTATPVA